MEEQSPLQPGSLLSSWKEIAAYLGINVRTAQKWEVERGLPVRRLPGGRGRVLARIDDLDAWMLAPVEGATSVKGRVALWRWLAGVIATAALFGVAGALWFSSRHGTPVKWFVEGDSLVVVDGRGRELWRRSSGVVLRDYRRLSDQGQEMGWVGDLDADGEPEVLFLVSSKDGRSSMVYCYSSDGSERWRFTPGARAETFSGDFHGPYHPENVVVLRVGGQFRIALASVHHTWYPSQIALLSGDGRLLREYWHSGHIQRLAVADVSGRPMLYAGGIANGYRRAVLVVLDPESFGGVSREENVNYQLPGQPAREFTRVLFPRSCVNFTKESFNGVASIRPTPTGLVVGVAEEVGLRSHVMHTFDKDSRYLGAGLSSQFAARHAELERIGLLNHRLDERRESVQLAQVDWLVQPSARVPPGPDLSTIRKGPKNVER